MFGIPGKQAVTMTPRATAQIARLMNSAGHAGLRIGVKKGGCAGMEYTMEYVDRADPNDEVVEQDGARILIAPSTTNHPLYDQVVEACRSVYDPEIPVNIYDLGLIYTIDISPENAVRIVMTLTAPGCPVAGEMPGWVVDAVEPLDGVKEVDVEMTFEPQWGMDMMSDEARLELGFM